MPPKNPPILTAPPLGQEPQTEWGYPVGGQRGEGYYQMPPTTPLPEPVSETVTAAKTAYREARNKSLIDEYLALLERYGVPPDSPMATTHIEMLSQLDTSPEGMLDWWAQAAAAEYYGGGLPYQQELYKSGFLEETIVYPEGQRPMRGRFAPTEGPAYAEQPDTGYLKYPNGTLVTPDGQVMFDPTQDAPGSEPWLRNAVATWAPSQVQAWRKKLVEWGYLPKEAKKGETVDVQMKDALRMYHIARYQNGGKPIALQASRGGGPEGDFMNFNQFRSSVENDVRATFITAFGDTPSEEELRRWTDFVIRTANNLQRGPKGLTGPQASAEAMGKLSSQVTYGPQATFINESVEENTAMQDSILRAIYATQGLT